MFGRRRRQRDEVLESLRETERRITEANERWFREHGDLGTPVPDFVPKEWTAHE